MTTTVATSRQIWLAALVVTFGIVRPASPVLAQSSEGLVGAWRLESMYVRDVSGKTAPYWGEKPTGLIVYTADGHMAAQVYDTRRPTLGVPWESAGAEAARVAFVGLSTYFGRYSVDPGEQTVTHTVEGAMVQDWVGTKLVRRYRFLTPDRVELSVVPDAQLPSTGLVLVWRRMPGK
jgi:hypothetical protein